MGKPRNLVKFAGGAALAAIALAGCFGPGNYPVSPQTGNGRIGVGLWHTAGNDGDVVCFAARRAPGGEFVGSMGSMSGPRYIEVKAGDASFTTTGCQKWVQAGGPFDKPTAGGAGDYRVGVELAPGTYVLRGTATCWWQRLNSWDGSYEAVIDEGGVGTVTVEPTDIGFRLLNCSI